MSLAHWPARSLEHFLMFPVGSPTHPFTIYRKGQCFLLLYSSISCGRYFCVPYYLYSLSFLSTWKTILPVTPVFLPNFSRPQQWKTLDVSLHSPFFCWWGQWLKRWLRYYQIEFLRNNVGQRHPNCALSLPHICFKRFCIVKNILFWRIKSLLF